MIREPHSITIPGKPAGKARPRVGQGGHFYSPKAGAFEAKVVQLAQQAWGTTPDDALYGVTVVVRKKIPDSWSKKRKAVSQGMRVSAVPDLCNIEAAIFDALEGILWHNDRQVVRRAASRVLWGSDEVIIMVSELKEGAQRPST